MISVEEALRLVEEHARPLAPQRVALGDAAELVLAEDVTSAVNSPPYDKTLMDGYAVVSSDRSQIRQVIEEIGAGSVPHRPVTPGTATRLMTGAPLPEGADAVVAFERTEPIDDHTVRFLQADPKPGQHTLAMGAALRVGQHVFERGVTLRPIEIGILAEIGHAVVQIQPKPKVAVLPTGNELVAVNERPAAGQIRNSNGPMLAAAIARAGGAPIELPVARDDLHELRRLITAGLDADVLLLCGGVSAGKFDLVPGALAELGVEQVFHKIALRPGKPLWFGVRQEGKRRTLVFGLPGNPVSSLVCFELFARPAIAALAGRGFATPSHVTAILSHDFHYKGGRASCLPAAISRPAADESLGETSPQARPSVEILPWHGSADLVALARANGLVRFGTESCDVSAGKSVQVLCL
ncbi:MAG: gephyrin-like molybdotransferase Glp [Pirellulales bacterium]